MGASVWAEAERVLCVRLDGAGDILMTTPAIRALKQAHPARRLTLLTSSAAAETALLVPEIDEALVYDAPWIKATAPRPDSRGEHAMAALLREFRFDAAAIFTVYSQSPLPAAFLCYLADIPLRLAHCRENPYQLLTDWVPESEPGKGVRHEVQRQMDLAAAVGCVTADIRLSLQVPEAVRRELPGILRAAGAHPTVPWIVLHPGASAPSRRYPAEKFAAAVRRLVAEDGWQLLLTGSEDEVELIDRIQAAAGVPTYSLGGRLSVVQLAAVIAEARLLIVNNTGPSHMAAALGTPVVTLYALTNPQHTPWAVPSRVLFHDVPCRFCYKSVCPQGHHECLQLVEPDEVVRAARELLADESLAVVGAGLGHPLGKVG